MPKLNKAKSTLPGVRLSELPEATKDFLIANSAAGISVGDVIREVLNKAASMAAPATQQPKGAAR